MVRQAFRNIDDKRLIDYHVHLVGLGRGNSGAYVNWRMQSLRFPLRYLRFMVYRNAAGITDNSVADSQYVARLLDLVRKSPHPGRYYLLAFDRHYRPDGTIDEQLTTFYTPNAYVRKTADASPDVFLPAVSIHPYRRDALQELEIQARQGVRVVKWLPNAMGIDPASSRCDQFYRLMKKYGMILLVHTGREEAVDAEANQILGNPLRLRRPLDFGVRVLAAHCAGVGKGIDLDDPSRPKVSNFRLFMRLMEEGRYRSLLYGEISALTLFNRDEGMLSELLQRVDIHERLRNGSDYPLPAINILIRTRTLQRRGFITPEERMYLNEVFDRNPLLFDFVLKRTVRDPRNGIRFSPVVFMLDPVGGI